MQDQLYQMNIAYVAKEDRLLLRVSTRRGDEYRLWLTRRFTSLLLSLIDQKMNRFGGAPSLAASQETRRMFKQGAMEKSYETEKALTFPLGEEGVLAHNINSKTRENGNLALQILPERGQGVTLNLNKTLLYMFYNVLTQGVDQAGWHLQVGDVSANVH